MKTEINRREFIKSTIATLSATGIALCSGKIEAKDKKMDIIIKGGIIVDGSGEVSYTGDIGIKGDTIVKIGNLSKSSAHKTIDAKGLIVCPGFIDIHTHYDGVSRPDLPDIETNNPDGIFKEELNKILLLQGITTVIGGNCGYSALDIEKHFAIFRKSSRSFNYGTLIGHGTLRKKVIGSSSITVLTEEEKNQIRNMIRRAMRQGAFGMSTNLETSSASLGNTKELIDIGKELIPFNGLLAIHRRNETEGVVQWTKEAGEICETLKIPVQISHFRVIGKPNWNKNDEMIEAVKKIAGKKLPLRCDFYPYDSCQGYMEYIFPEWAKKGALLMENLKDNIMRERVRLHFSEQFSLIPPENIYTYTKSIPDIYGKNLYDAAQILGMSPAESAIEIALKDESGRGGIALYRYAIARGNYEALIKSQFAIISSDGGFYSKEDAASIDPRVYGTFPKIFGFYVREKKLLKMEEAVRRVTKLPADQLGLKKRGLLREGMIGDITVFDPVNIADLSTYEDPAQYPVGIEYVLVSGKITVEKGKYNGKKEGKILKKFT